MSQSRTLTFHMRSPLDGRPHPISIPTGRTWEIKDSNDNVIAVSPESYETAKECREARDKALKYFQETEEFSLPLDEK